MDPLDGTTNFLHGFPVYAVSIAVAVEGVVEAGVILDVPRGDRYTAIRGGGALAKRRARFSVSTIDDPSKALIGTGFPFKHLVYVDAYQRQFAAVVRTTSGIRRAGAAALDLAAVANGWFEAFWELSLAPWDMAAGVLLVREAGGVVTDLDGRRRDWPNARRSRRRQSADARMAVEHASDGLSVMAPRRRGFPMPFPDSRFPIPDSRR